MAGAATEFSPYREESPAYFWILAAAMSMFGSKNEAAIRLPSVLLAIAGCWLLLAWGWRHMRPISGTFAVLVLSTAAGTVAIGRLGIDDAVSGFLLAIALTAMSEPLLTSRGGARFPWLFYVALAGAILCLGPSPSCSHRCSRQPYSSRSFASPAVCSISDRSAGSVCSPHWSYRSTCSPRLATRVRLGIASSTTRSVFSIRTSERIIRHRSSRSWRSRRSCSCRGRSIFLGSLRDALRSGGERSAYARLYLVVWLFADLGFFLLSTRTS